MHHFVRRAYFSVLLNPFMRWLKTCKCVSIFDWSFGPGRIVFICLKTHPFPSPKHRYFGDVSNGLKFGSSKMLFMWTSMLLIYLKRLSFHSLQALLTEWVAPLRKDYCIPFILVSVGWESIATTELICLYLDFIQGGICIWIVCMSNLILVVN